MTTELTTQPTVLKTDILGRVATPSDQREALLNLFEQSGMSGAAFARHYGLRYTTFANWRQVRRREQLGLAPKKPPPKKALFHEVVVESADHGACSLNEAEPLVIQLPCGVHANLTSPSQAPLVAALIRELEPRC